MCAAGGARRAVPAAGRRPRRREAGHRGEAVVCGRRARLRRAPAGRAIDSIRRWVRCELTAKQPQCGVSFMASLQPPTANVPDSAPCAQELNAHLRAATLPEALEALSLCHQCGTAVEVAGGTGTVARIVARLLECAREAVPTARAQAATSPPAAPLTGSDRSPGDSTAAAAAAETEARDVVVEGDRFDMPAGVLPACLVGITLRGS